MMNNFIKFEKLIIKNFLSVADLTINFDDYMGSNYVYGINEDVPDKNNGSGKSTIFSEALLFALFNKMTKDITKKSIPHRLEKGNCYVDVIFTIDSIRYKVHNSIKPVQYTLYKYDETDNEIDISKSSSKETLMYLEKDILKTNFDVFKISLILSSSTIQNIYEMSKSEKRTFIEHVMDISHIGRMYSKAKEKVNELEREITIKRNRYNSINNELKNFQEKKDNFEINRQTELSLIEKEYNDVLKQIDNETNKLPSFILKELKELKEINNDNNRSQLEQKKNEYEQYINKLKEAITKSKYEIQNIDSNIQQIKNNYIKYEKVLETICSECKTKINNNIIVDNSNELNEKKNAITEKQQKLQLKITEINELKLNNDKELIKYIEIDQYNQKINQENHKITLENQKINQEKQLQEQKINYIKLSLNSINSKKEMVLNKTNNFTEIIQKYESELTIINNELDLLDNDKRYWSFISNIMSENGVRKTMLSDFVDILNNRIRTYLEDIGCEYVPVIKEDFSSDFITKSGPCEYGNFSNGEKGSIDISTMLSFRDIVLAQGIIKSNVLVCDEILDNKGIDRISFINLNAILKKLSSDKCLFLISHRECIDPEQFDRVVNVRKKNGRTYIND